METQLSPYFTNSNPGPSPVAPGFVQAAMGMGDNIQRGMASASQDLLEGFMKHKQNVQDAAAADTTFKMLAPQMEKAGVQMDPDVLAKFAGSSLSAKKGMIGAMSMQYASALKTASDQATVNESNARAKYYGDVGTARVQTTNEQEADDASMAHVFQKFVADPNAEKLVSPGTYATLKAFAGENVSPRVQAQVMRQVLPTITGTGAPAKAQPTITTLKDANGKSYNVMVDQATGKPTVLPDKTGKYPKGTTFSKGTLSAVYPDGTMDVVGHENGQAAMVDSVLGGGSGAAGAPAGGATAQPNNPMAMPMINGKPDPTQMQVGQIYDTAKGPATWDGTQFTQ